MENPTPFPHTEEEIAEIKEGFSKLPSYKNGYVDYPDYHKLIKEHQKWELSDSSIDALIDLLKPVKKENIHLDEMERYLKICLDIGFRAGEIVKKFEIDEEGYIFTDEAEEIFNFLKAHDPKLKDITFEKFTEEADLNHDGRASVEEAQAWVVKNLG